MSLRHAVAPTLAALLLCASAQASQPERYALKMLSNPAVVYDPDPEDGLPPIVFGGFRLFEEVPGLLSAAETLRLELALVPFRGGATYLELWGFEGVFGAEARILLLVFQDGLVQGLPYDAGRFNDVQVEVHVATQDYDLIVNGIHAGPLPLSEACIDGLCDSLSVFTLGTRVPNEDVGWVDSIRLERVNATGTVTLLELPFDFVHPLPVTGGTLVLEPPRRLRPRGTASTAGALPEPEPVVAAPIEAITH